MITRENYEEFFLSYVDNELPAETRQAVENFAAANPDLREELETLVQCRFSPESDAVYPDKNSLLQYEESLLLYVDGELDDAGRKTVEDLASREPRIGLELDRLKITVSRPDTSMVFPDKGSLYHPVKRRRVVMMPWLQAAAAAAVVGVVVVLLLPHERKTDVPAIAVAKKIHPAVTPPDASPLYSGKNATTATSPEKSTLPAPAVAENAARRTNVLTPTTGTAYAVPNGTHGVRPATHPSDASRQLASTRSSSTDRSTAPEGLTETTGAMPAGATTAARSTKASNATAALNATDATNSPAASNQTTASNQGTASGPTTSSQTEKAAATSVAAVNIPKEQRSFATQALLREAQEEGDGDVAAGNMAPTTGKTKLRGLLRRVTRTFGKTADRDDDGGREVSISVFQVALK